MSVAYGSVFDTITTSTFKTINVILPPKETMDKAKSEIDTHFERIKHNVTENQTLTNLRNTLLPKLISGEVRVKDIEHQIKDVL